MSEPDFVLLDKHGRPIPSTQMTKRMEESLKEFIYVNQNRLRDFWLNTTWGARPPIKYDTDNQKWFWDEKEQRDV